ncbi:MAG: undecaprenyl-diphosphate phosphatase [Methanobrevibacter thaueri]|jgi:undecaprenyl-diphosphatase|uniref:undecaprenyl-diphosphate phosphatase n=1 Tax=Methanobrevibacter thaueri TaxID=190975 RepID=UPI0026EE6705|nr:undecaprenyl-diphosphate phosphatase [Methanobrevibacter thaueri]MBE6495695.1 undecaprenyl-diphosphate phosphatase [Methanobrevibacter thaueri]
MDILQGIIIGIVQGLTEFLPVSSSAHLVFIQNLLGVESSLAFDTFLHLGTLIAVLWYFRYDIYKMLKSWWLSIGDILQGRFKEGFYSDPYKRLAWYVILATIPVGIVGVLFEDSVDALFSGALYVPAFFLFVTGTILYLSQRMTSGEINYDTITKKEALFMGLGQACAILPGLSRSGTTIAAGLTIGLDKEFAAKFSFILSIPAIFGAFILQVKDIGSAMDANFLPVFLGFVAAIIAGYMAIKWMLDLIQNKNLDIFAYYCWLMGLIVFMGSIAHIF